MRWFTRYRSSLTNHYRSRRGRKKKDVVDAENVGRVLLANRPLTPVHSIGQRRQLQELTRAQRRLSEQRKTKHIRMAINAVMPTLLKLQIVGPIVAGVYWPKLEIQDALLVRVTCQLLWGSARGKKQRTEPPYTNQPWRESSSQLDSPYYCRSSPANRRGRLFEQGGAPWQDENATRFDY